MMNYKNPTIGQCVAWPHIELNTDYKTGANIWREVTQEFADEMRDCVPPVYVAGVPGLMVGEAYTHDSTGSVIYCGFVKLCGRWFARNVAKVDFAGAVTELAGVLNVMEETTKWPPFMDPGTVKGCLYWARMYRVSADNSRDPVSLYHAQGRRRYYLLRAWKIRAGRRSTYD